MPLRWLRLRLPRVPRRTILGCVGQGDTSPLFTRFILRRTRLGNWLIHCFHRSDAGRDFHDHPWPFVTLILWNGYIEETPRGRRRLWPGMIQFRPARWVHRVELVGGRPSWSMVWTFRREREWGYHTEKGWVHWRTYSDEMGCGGEV